MKRRGFTLIELMVVIAIIIILAAIAIPNYLSMTARAKRSRVASDMNALATSLESYRTDWNKYPTATATTDASKVAVNSSTGILYYELTGDASAVLNKKGATSPTTATGDLPGQDYMKPGALTSMTNPMDTSITADKGNVIYYTTIGTGAHWVLYVWSADDAAYYSTSDSRSQFLKGNANIPTPDSAAPAS